MQRVLISGTTDEEQNADLQKTITYLHKKGWQIALHACGDRMVDNTLDAYIATMEEFPREDPRHYIIHSELITSASIKKAAQHHIGFSIQPTIDALLHPAYEDIKLVWGKDGSLGAEDMSPYKALFESVANVAGGSDCPVIEPNWRQSVQDAITRKDVLGKPFNVSNAISVEDGIRMFTINGAIQEKMEHVRGSIEVGKFADLQVLQEDILTADIDKIGQIEITMTIVNGDIVYSV
ncbi:amidohydrolase family protein [Eubacteriaceae bacterium ES2]|nr:amidohydrolase family protein [Eubacteriaceae bacterium ES2]